MMSEPKYQPCLHVVLFQPEIPQNTGNIGRTCVAIGAKLWLVRPLGFRLDNARLRRAGLADWQQLMDRLEPRQLWCFTKFAERRYSDVTYQRGAALVLGSETQGLPPTL